MALTRSRAETLPSGAICISDPGSACEDEAVDQQCGRNQESRHQVAEVAAENDAECGETDEVRVNARHFNRAVITHSLPGCGGTGFGSARSLTTVRSVASIS